MSDPNKSSSSSSSGKDHAFEYLAIPYDEFDVLVSDINERELKLLGEAYEPANLSLGTFPSPEFPAGGVIHGRNIRYMVPLVCQRAGKPTSRAINVWFLVDTGSPFTCLTVKSLEAIFGQGNVTGDDDKFYPIAIQDQDCKIECQTSKGHFEEVNLLGADAMRKLELSIVVDWKKDKFKLVKQ